MSEYEHYNLVCQYPYKQCTRYVNCQFPLMSAYKPLFLCTLISDNWRCKAEAVKQKLMKLGVKGQCLGQYGRVTGLWKER